MSGLFAFSVAGLGFLLVGSFESLSPFISATNSFHFLSAAALSSLAILNSLVSSLDALRPPPRRDPLGLALQLDSLAAASLFLVYALAGLLSSSSSPRTRLLLPLPPSALDLVCLFAFGQEFLLFSLQRKDPSGVENRYYDLLLVPVTVCALSTVLCAARPRSPFPRLARGLGLVLQGTWFVQMGFSFFSSAMAHGCALHERSRGNYTVKCKDHPEYHRGRAIATLQFNCHLAFLVVVAMGVYSAVVARRREHGVRSDLYQKYKPLSEMQRLDNPPSQFTLESDDEGVDEGGGEIVAEVQRRPMHQDGVLPVSGVNGFGGAH